ncbi:MAG: putative ABC transporter ATP-binding protein [Chlamydiae bacterium]|nr:putative ABC transporter ATP-binding protein [Chlamydiota bacterium]
MKVAVKCRGVTKTYGEEEETLVHALRGVDLEVNMGELLMIVGPSGCGKTTLLSIISGILRHDEGECHVLDHDLNKMDEVGKTSFRKENIGFIFQALHLIPSLNAMENASLPLILQGIEPEEAYSKAEEMLAKVGLEKRKHALPSHLSGGEQQRVAICRGCIHNPKLIVCDEPTSTLDHQTGMKVMQLFRDIVIEEGKALIVVTHDSRIYEFADRILQMDDGHILGPLPTRPSTGQKSR